jgi:uncharacterized protein with HEPN domain
MPSRSLGVGETTSTYRDNIYLARRFVEGLDLRGISRQSSGFLRRHRCLEIISEASRRLPAEMKARHPGIPWAEMAGAEYIYRRDYEDVQQRLVWGTVHRRFPALLAAVEPELSRFDPRAHTESKGDE